ncbi:MAG: TlpA family protein disulfide reductase [Muribaculaceae bacterium]|nr:TlpA family protein disulfide reductase [Muribaculaceae bacterium]
MRKQKVFHTIFISLIICVAGCVSENEEPVWYLQAGDALPQFEVTTIEGKKVNSADSYVADLIIVFFNTTCPDCRRELPILQKQYEENLKRPEDTQKIYICISREENAVDVERYWTENNLTLPVSPQTDRSIYSMFASIGIPRIFYAKNGIIIRTCEP